MATGYIVGTLGGRKNALLVCPLARRVDFGSRWRLSVACMATSSIWECASGGSVCRILFSERFNVHIKMRRGGACYNTSMYIFFVLPSGNTI